MFTRLIESLSATEALSQVFSDEGVLQSMLDFEAALARAEARVGLIPSDAAAAITDAAVAEGFDIAELVRQSLRAGTPAIPLVRMLTERVRARDAAAADFVHWGATSQDVTDTAMVLLLGRCRRVLEADHERVSRGLAAAIGRSCRHRDAGAHAVAARAADHLRTEGGRLAGRGAARLGAGGEPLRRSGVPAVRRRQRNPGRTGQPRPRGE